jgi:hypothetical protein
LRDLFTNHVRDPARISLALKLISETNEHQSSTMKKEFIKVIIILAEVFEEKLVEFLPKILSIILKRIKEDDPQLNSACTETMGTLISTCLKGLPTQYLTEQLAAIFKNFLRILPKSGKYSQIGAAMCITKIVQTSPVECILKIGEEILQKLIEIMGSSACKARLQIMEAFLSIILATEDQTEKLQKNCELFLPIVVEGFENSDWNIRKLSIEIIYTFSDLVPELIISQKTVIVEALNKLRFDKVWHLLIQRVVIKCINAIIRLKMFVMWRNSH